MEVLETLGPDIAYEEQRRKAIVLGQGLEASSAGFVQDAYILFFTCIIIKQLLLLKF